MIKLLAPTYKIGISEIGTSSKSLTPLKVNYLRISVITGSFFVNDLRSNLGLEK